MTLVTVYYLGKGSPGSNKGLIFANKFSKTSLLML